MTTFYYVISILFCIGFIWGMNVRALDNDSLWWFRGMIGGCIFAMLIITAPIAIYSLWRKNS